MISSYLIVSLPWFAGGLICLALVGSPKDAQHSQSHQLKSGALPPELLLGFGGLLGYLFWGYGLWVADQLGHTLLSPYSIVFLVLLAVLALYLMHSLREHYERQHVAVSAWQKLIGGSNGPGKLVVLDPADVFCEDGECSLYNKETSFYLDDDHASTNGFGRLENLIGEAIFEE